MLFDQVPLFFFRYYGGRTTYEVPSWYGEKELYFISHHKLYDVSIAMNIDGVAFCWFAENFIDMNESSNCLNGDSNEPTATLQAVTASGKATIFVSLQLVPLSRQ